MLTSITHQLETQGASVLSMPPGPRREPAAPAQFGGQQVEPVHRDPMLRLAARQDLGAPRLGGGQDVALRRLLGTMSDLLTVQDIDRVARTVAVERILRGGGPLEQAPVEAEADARPLLANLRHLIEGGHLAAARVLLDAAPLSVLNDPLVMKLRAVLAPPVVTRLQRHDV